jgi:hypothetical protein
MSEYRKIPCVIQRGGTSKGVFLHEKDLPSDPELRSKVILAIFGSPDKRQIDGLGGADPLTSKVAIIGPSSRPDCDIDYTFGAVDLTEPIVDFKGNCGNISSGVGPFAVDEGLVHAADGIAPIRIFNTNTKKILRAFVPVDGGRARYGGDYAIAGVPGTGAKILLDYAGTAGALTGKILPTGNRVDTVSVPGVGTIEISIVDAGNPVCFIKPSVVNLSGTESPLDASVIRVLNEFEAIRAVAAEMIGLVEHAGRARIETPSVPMIAMVSKPKEYVSFTDGRRINPNEIDFVSRVFYMQEMHKTYSVTAAVCTGVAAMIEGTIVNQVTSSTSIEAKTVRIGHPSGVITLEVDLCSKSGLVLEKAAMGRTSRRIMEGFVYVPESLFNESNQS